MFAYFQILNQYVQEGNQDGSSALVSSLTYANTILLYVGVETAQILT